MSSSQLHGPAVHRVGNGGAPARRAVFRWALRLFRREWRQQLLVLILLIVAVAATTVGLAIAVNAPSTPEATFGTANYLLTLPGSDRRLAADITAARKWFGSIEVIEHQNVKIPGSLNTVDLRAQQPDGRFGHPMLRLDAGRYPAGPGQVAVTSGVAAIYRLRIGGLWHAGDRALRVVGTVENPQNLLENFALVAPGQASPPTNVTILLDSTAARADAFHPRSAIAFGLQARPSRPQNGFPTAGVLLFAAIGLLFVGLVAVAGFTVMAGRRLRALGMLAAIGATDRHVRLVMTANGALAGVTAAVTGAALGLAGWLASVPRIEVLVEHRIDGFSLPWLDIFGGMLLAVVTAIAAAWWPARTAARIPVTAALSGRPPRPRPRHRSAVIAGLILVAGLGMLALSRGGGMPVLTIAGLLTTVLGVLLLGPLAIRGLAAAGRGAPIAVRLALRDLARYQARSGAALAAIGLALGIAAAITIGAAESAAAAAIPPSAGNLPPNQLMVYLTASENPSSFGGGAVPARTPAQLHALQARVDALAARLHAPKALGLDAAAAPTAPYLSPSQGGPGKQTTALVKRARADINGQVRVGYENPDQTLLYVATPALLAQFGIKPASINPAADVLTSNKHLAGSLLADWAGQQSCPGGEASCRVHRNNPHGPLPVPAGLAHPDIERIGLPRYTSDPTSLITLHAVRLLGLRLLPAGWLIQAPRPLTAAQVIAAEHWAAAAGLTVETRSEPAQQNLSRLATEATAVGVLVALGVLAMTIGLIRSETAGDLRTLTATGASDSTRRTLTGATAGGLALLGALLGIGAAYLAVIAASRGVYEVTHVPVVNLAIMIIGLPAAAAITGWLLAGREPQVIARQPLL